MVGTFSIGLDLGGTNLRAACYAPSSGLLARAAIRTRLEAGPQAVAQDIGRVIRELRLTEPDSSLIGISIAAPGPLELPGGRFHQPPNLPGWDGFALRESLQSEFDAPVTMENDANAAALAEYHLGSGREPGIESLCMLTLGTGVGGGIVSRGRIMHGSNGLAAESGHITIYPEGHLCSCGNRGCLEMYASATAIRAQALAFAELHPFTPLSQLLRARPNATTADLFRIASDGDTDACTLFEQAGQALGIGIAGLVNVLNPSLVVLAGGLSDAWPLLAPSLFRELRSRSYVYRLTESGSSFRKQTIVRPAVLGSDAGLLGAALLPFLAAGEEPAPISFNILPAVLKPLAYTSAR